MNRARQILHRLRGERIRVDLREFLNTAREISAQEPALREESDQALQERALELRERIFDGQTPDDLLVEAFALVREAARRVTGERLYETQILAGLALNSRDVAQMQTGEGKTLAAVAPAWLASLRGRGVHILTFNDYLARRDAGWMGPIYEFLGARVAYVQEGMSRDQRRSAYGADITYLTAREAGFDYLRDNLCVHREDRVQRPFHLAIIDEADSILIDEGRVPLVIAGEDEQTAGLPLQAAAVARHLVEGLHYDVDEGRRNLHLTEEGVIHGGRLFECGSLVDAENLETLTELNMALQARVLLHQDVDYIVREGRVQVVDEFTGRVVQNRHWPDGLQAALEAKEGLERQKAGRILGQITLRHFFEEYPELAGMTATAISAHREMQGSFDLGITVIPPHRTSIRRDHPDRIFSSTQAKSATLIEEISQLHRARRPVLVGTATVEESERLARQLEDAGISCNVLNARCDEAEAAIIAEAGALDAVTISTNMAGRGTDIRLGGADEAQRDQVVALGGLFLIGTHRHESRRIDDQLRGRAGRQGDPGETCFFISLEDDLFVKFGLEEVVPRRYREGGFCGEIDDRRVGNEIARAQRILEGQNFEIRRTLDKYSAISEDHRRILLERRLHLLFDPEGPSLLRENDPALEAKLLEQVGEEVLEESLRQVSLFHLDHCWADHLALLADTREQIHLVAIGGRDPQEEFVHLAEDALRETLATVDQQILETLATAEFSSSGVDLEKAGLKGPSSTWTYLVNDNPAEDGLRLVSGVAGTGFGVGISFLWPLFLLWGLLRRSQQKQRAKQ